MSNKLLLQHYQITLFSTIGILGWMSLIGTDPILRIIMMGYFLMDIVFFYKTMKPDMICHHVLSCLLVMFYYQPYDEETTCLLAMEISTPFLILCRLHIYETINRLLFLFFFTYFRIFRIGLLLFRHQDEIYSFPIWLSFLLYLLNWYWFEMIVRHHLVGNRVKEYLIRVVPYSHYCSSLVILLKKQYHMLGIGLLSSVSSYLWHQYKTMFYYVLDLSCFHLLSFYVNWNYVSTNWKFLSLPFHIMDIISCNNPHHQHQLWLCLSVGYDVLMVFYHYNQNFLWLFGWLLVFLMIVKQTFGCGSTQTVCHFLIAILFSRFL